MRTGAALLAALSLSACAASEPAKPVAAQPLSLEGTRWASSSDPNSAARLEFLAGGRLTGYTGCNGMSGSYTFDGDRIEIIAAATKRFCMGAGGDTEVKFLAVIADRPRAALVGGKLVLTTPKGDKLELERK